MEQSAGTTERKRDDEHRSLPGVSDGIEQHKGTEDEPGGSEGSWLEPSEQGSSMSRDRKGSGSKDQDRGMETGIAKKSGNADGVKVSTAMNRGTRNIPHISKMEKEWQVIHHG